MKKFFSALAVSAFLASPLMAEVASTARTPNEIVAAAPAADWKPIAPSDLLVMDLAPDSSGTARRVVIQLIPAPFSQGWVGNIRELVAARWYDGIAVVRVQDNYVAQWGDPEGENPTKAKPLPAGLAPVREEDYAAKLKTIVGKLGKAGDLRTAQFDLVFEDGVRKFAKPVMWDRDAYADKTVILDGWPAAMGSSQSYAVLAAIGKDQILFPEKEESLLWPIHCYGTIGVGRNNSPDTGSGAELYAVIGHAPRQLDRNVAIVGRVISGIEHLSALPRGTGEIGFYKTPQERVAIRSVRVGNEVADLPGYEYLSTESPSFAAYVDKRANREDAFYIHPAGGVDVCNVPVPVREVSR